MFNAYHTKLPAQAVTGAPAETSPFFSVVFLTHDATAQSPRRGLGAKKAIRKARICCTQPALRFQPSSGEKLLRQPARAQHNPSACPVCCLPLFLTAAAAAAPPQAASSSCAASRSSLSGSTSSAAATTTQRTRAAQPPRPSRWWSRRRCGGATPSSAWCRTARVCLQRFSAALGARLCFRPHSLTPAAVAAAAAAWLLLTAADSLC